MTVMALCRNDVLQPVHKAGWLAPMLATPGVLPVINNAYAYEVKWDGFRAVSGRERNEFFLTSRNGIDLLPRFPEIGDLCQALPPDTIVDGELVALDGKGQVHFSALQTRMPSVRGISSGRKWNSKLWHIQYIIFDLLRLRGRNLMTRPWSERRHHLDELDLNGMSWITPPAVSDGGLLLSAVRQANGEGIIAKRRDASYVPGSRSRHWIKIKLVRHDEFVIGGFWRRNPDHDLGSVLVGRFATAADARNQRLTFCGKVGTSFTSDTRHGLTLALEKNRQSVSPFTTAVPSDGITWTRPALVAEIGYAEWTSAGHLRHARFEGLCADKPARIVLAPVGEHVDA